MVKDSVFIELYQDDGNSLNKTIKINVLGLSSFNDIKFSVDCENVPGFSDGSYDFEFNASIYAIYPGHSKQGQTTADNPLYLCYLFTNKTDCTERNYRNSIDYSSASVTAGTTYYGLLHSWM